MSYARAVKAAGTDQEQYFLFWAGVLVFMGPAVALCAQAATRRARIGVVTLTGLFLYVPKILRNPFGPVYHDSLAHWLQVQNIATAGHLFVPNAIISVISQYPGIHIVILTMQRLTGLSTWGSAMVLIALLHVLDLLAVYVIIETFTDSPRAGGVGAILYALNPSYMYFHTQFSYETLGITLFLLTILTLVLAERASTRRARLGWSGGAAIIGAACAVTHHLSTLLLCSVLIAWSGIAYWKARRDAMPLTMVWPVMSVTCVILAFFGSWILFVAPETLNYLTPYLGQSLGQLIGVFIGKQQGRVPFGGSSNPGWERLMGLASPLVVLAGITIAGCSLWKRHSPTLHRSRSLKENHLGGDFTVAPVEKGQTASGRSSSFPLAPRGLWSAGHVTLCLFGLIYFVSIPFALVPSGSEAAHRIWGFSYLGLAVILAPMVVESFDRLQRSQFFRRRLAMAVLLMAFAVVLVGNVASGENPAYRFPGPYRLGSDAHTYTPQVRQLARWFRATGGPNNKVVTDYYTGLALAAFGRQTVATPSAAFPTWQLWLNRGAPSAALLRELNSSGYRYLVIDKRMTGPSARIETFFGGATAVSTDGTSVVTAASLARFTQYTWLSKVYESSSFAVYRFQFDSPGIPLAPQGATTRTREGR